MQRCVVCEKLRLPRKTGWLKMEEMSERYPEALVDMDTELVHCDSCGEYDEDQKQPTGKPEPRKRRKPADDDDEHDGFEPGEGQYRSR